MSTKVSLGGQAIRGSVITGLSQALKIFIQFISVPLLARLLLPEDFGLIASTAPVIAFISIFQSLGLSQAIVQRQDISDLQLTQIFRATLILGSICAGIVIAASPAVAWFYGDPRLLLITCVAALPVFMGAISSVPAGLLNRRMQFVPLAVIDLASAITAFVVAVSAAALGLGYWSLVLSTLLSGVVAFSANWIAAGWRPVALAGAALDRSIVSFGANITGFTFVYFFWRNLDVVLIGRTAGSHQLGLYDRAYKLLLFPLQNINAPMSRVMVPLLSRLQGEPERFRTAYLKALGQLTLLAVPGVAAMATVPHELTAVLFGPRWAEVAPIFGWLAFAGLMEPLAGTTSWVFISLDRTRVMLRWGVYAAITVVIGMILGLRYGAVGVAAAYAIGHYTVRYPVLFTVIGRTSPVKTLDLILLQGPLLIAAAVNWVLVQYLFRQSLGLQGMALIISAVTSSYFVAFAILAMHPRGREVLGDSMMLLNKARTKLLTLRK